ncbi:MAG: hypothetical protein ACLQU4_11060 [Limisphaerales bacterium]
MILNPLWGRFNPSGFVQWLVIGSVGVLACRRKAPITPPCYTDTELVDIAERQKAIIWLILLATPAMVAFAVTPYIPIIFIVLSVVFIYQLAAALKEPSPWLYVIVGLMPCISLITLLVINARAITALKTRGVRVGLMGALKNDLDKITKNAD